MVSRRSGRSRKSIQLCGVPTTFGRHCSFLPDWILLLLILKSCPANLLLFFFSASEEHVLFFHALLHLRPTFFHQSFASNSNLDDRESQLLYYSTSTIKISPVRVSTCRVHNSSLLQLNTCKSKGPDFVYQL